ncbi:MULTISPECIES: hypothetical protein [Trichocoleus]|uniref:Uncharacterized protein n=1 Tax=Trichocoleus desertorum GB2-A4 TaxID=2933944 RepID=A0ABV0JAM6_9CYAN|nr:hypothetical protein [Trichocoleus sp. FACHB-46]MBD1861112.1 hypothetical protein [Trichocoleus sp. FACHB-46]
MTNPCIRSLSPWRTLQRITQPALGILLLTSLSGVALQAVNAAESTSAVVSVRQLERQPLTPAPTAKAIAKQAAPSKNSVKSSANSKNSPLADGTYLYGEAAEPEQVGSAYMVFQVTKGKVVGAFYMPRSSFDCFSGSFEPGKLALNVVDTYEKTTHPFAIALEQNSTIASNSNKPAVAEIGLQGFQRLAKVSANDQRILGMCQTNSQKNQAK